MDSGRIWCHLNVPSGEGGQSRVLKRKEPPLELNTDECGVGALGRLRRPVPGPLSRWDTPTPARARQRSPPAVPAAPCLPRQCEDTGCSHR